MSIIKRFFSWLMLAGLLFSPKINAQPKYQLNKKLRSSLDWALSYDNMHAVTSEVTGNASEIFLYDTKPGKSEFTNKKQLTCTGAQNRHPCIAYDKIVWTSNMDGNWEIYIMNEDGSGKRRLTYNPAADVAPALSWDESKVVFMSVRNGNPDIWLMNSNGGNQRNITNTPLQKECNPWFSPSGKYITFSGTAVGIWEKNKFNGAPDEIFILNLNTGRRKRLTFNTYREWDPRFINEYNIWFEREVPGKQNSIYLYDLTNGDAQPIIEDASFIKGSYLGLYTFHQGSQTPTHNPVHHQKSSSQRRSSASRHSKLTNKKTKPVKRKPLPGSSFSFTSSQNRHYTFHYQINRNSGRVTLSFSNEVPSYVKREARFTVAFNEFIDMEYGSFYNSASSLEQIINGIDKSATDLINQAESSTALRRLGDLVALNVYTGGLNNQQNINLLKNIGSNYVLSTVADIAEYYHISSESMEGKIISDLIKVAASAYISSSSSDPKAELVRDVRLSFYAQLGLAKRRLQRAAKILLSNPRNYKELDEAYYNFREGYVRAYAVLEGWKMLEDENFSDQIAGSIADIAGSYIVKQIRKSNTGNKWLNFFSDASKVANGINNLVTSPEERKQKEIERLFKQTYIGDVFHKVESTASNNVKKFYLVDANR